MIKGTFGSNQEMHPKYGRVKKIVPFVLLCRWTRVKRQSERHLNVNLNVNLNVI